MNDTILGTLLLVIAVVNVYWAGPLYTLNTLTGTSEVVPAGRAKSSRFKRWSQLSAASAFPIVLLDLIFRGL